MSIISLLNIQQGQCTPLLILKSHHQVRVAKTINVCGGILKWTLSETVKRVSFLEASAFVDINIHQRIMLKRVCDVKEHVPN